MSSVIIFGELDKYVVGLNLDQFIPPDLGNTTVTILNGDVIIELNDHKKNFSLKAGDVFQVITSW